MAGAADLAFGLAAVADSGYSGVAWLHDEGDGTASVTILIMAAGGMDAGM